MAESIVKIDASEIRPILEKLESNSKLSLDVLEKHNRMIEILYNHAPAEAKQELNAQIAEWHKQEAE